MSGRRALRSPGDKARAATVTGAPFDGVIK